MGVFFFLMGIILMLKNQRHSHIHHSNNLSENLAITKLFQSGHSRDEEGSGAYWLAVWLWEPGAWV